MSNTDFPDVKLKVLVSFPSTAIGGAGIEVEKVNGNFVVDLDAGLLLASGARARLPPKVTSRHSAAQT